MIAAPTPPLIDMSLTRPPDGNPAVPRDAGGLDPESSFALVLRARSGDEAALNLLVERYSKRLQIWAHGRLPAWARGPEETSDLVQDTLLQVVRRLDTFVPRHEGAFLAYVRQTLRNNVINRVRSAQRRGPVEPLESSRMSPEPGPYELTSAALLLDRYEDALQRLKPSYREAIIARIELRLSWVETQVALGKPSIPATQMTVSRALVRLAREMSHVRPA